ncbi:MAG TPA: hypothetical protein VHW04_14285 [Solirubrobacteraceae bacterium]|jgi:hypothetical protein|nr:hypothetical protein [Solirubrobacteraceae bacterium]
MKRLLLVLAASLVAAVLAVAPGAASAKIVELGQTSTPLAAPECPKGVSASQCFIILTRTTAVQTTSDGVAYPTKVKRAGWIVAFSLGLSRLSTDATTERKFLHTLDQAYGGTPQVALTVLRPGPKNSFTVVSQSGTLHLIPFLGQVLQEPLSLPPTFKTMTPLAVKPGDVIGLTVPTWAPVLTYNLNASKFAYRQSRKANCKNSATSNTAQTKVGQSEQYLCSYTGTRVQYSATEVLNAPYPKTYVHGPRQP